MKVDSADIDKVALSQLLKAEYGLDVATLSFVPAGEESYGYIAETVTQRQYFVKVYDQWNPPHVHERYQAVHLLATQCGLEYVVRPYQTRQGQFLAAFDKRLVAVYDFIEGTVSDQSGFSDGDWAQAARLTASLHQSSQCSLLPQLPAEQFELWFQDWLLRVLNAADETRPPQNEYQQQARQLLRREKADILATLEKLEQLANQARTTTGEHSLTHGDLKPENWIKDRRGNLHLIDWSKLSFAPPEKDLINFSGERLELFLRHYLGGYEEPPKLQPELFGYYHTFLLLWGIADYGSWILLEEVDLVETSHAWQELSNHLPINHQAIQAEVDQVGQIVKRVLSESTAAAG
jgi:hypothetical protein